MTESENAQENQPENVIVETRFGDIEFAWDKAIYMPIGLLGFAEHHVFGLANIPGQTDVQFKLYQSLTDAHMSFIISPYDLRSGVYSDHDLEVASKGVAVPIEHMTILLVVTIRSNGEGGVKMSVNLQAPIIVDTERQVAWQYIMRNDIYPVQQDI